MKRFPEYQTNAKIRRTRDVSALSRLALLLFCGLVLAGGFVFAAKQHFAAVQYGYQSESLRRERSKLLDQQQRLTLDKARFSSPARLQSAASSLGLKPATAAQISSLAAPAGTEKRNSKGGNDKSSSARTR